MKENGQSNPILLSPAERSQLGCSDVSNTRKRGISVKENGHYGVGVFSARQQCKSQPVSSRFAFVICVVFIELPLLQKQAAQGSQVVQNSEAGGHVLTQFH